MATLRVGVDARALHEPPGGLRRYATGLLPELLRLGRHIDWTLYVSQPSAETWRASLQVVPGSQRALLRPWWETISLPAAIGSRPPDVFFSPCGPVPRLRCPVVATLHDLAFLEEPNSLSWRHAPYWRWVARRLCRATTVIAVSEATRGVALRRLRLAPERIVTIPNGVDPLFRPAPAEHAARVCQRLGLHRDFVLAVAPWIARKNLATLAEAVARVGERRGQVLPLVIVGRPDREAQQSFPHVAALGQVDDDTLVALMSAAAVFAVPSLDEGFGLTLIEAMACGAPCITSDAGALPEVNGGAGLLVPPRDIEAWADAITQILAGPSLRRDLCQRSLARAQAFSWPHAAARTLELIEGARR